MANWILNDQDCKSIQISLLEVFAITIHRAQRLTLDRVDIDIGKKGRITVWHMLCFSELKNAKISFSKLYNFFLLPTLLNLLILICKNKKNLDCYLYIFDYIEISIRNRIFKIPYCYF